ncbi:MAG TPA: inositol monophosphatase family protein, partial [Thermoanaerobaculia bacterium]
MHEVDAAIEAANLGAAVLLRHWEQLGKGDADIKARNDWVSRADRESEIAIVTALQQHFSDDGILGEEGGRAKGSSGRTWIIDPLDGTSNYLQHFPIWSISIGLKSGNEMIAGVIYEPLRDLFFTGERGAGAFRNGVRMHVSDQRTVEGSFLATGF